MWAGLILDVAILLLFMLANGVFAMAELAVVSARKVRLETRSKRGDRGAKRALELQGAPGRFLSTVQVGITLIGVLSGAFGGATLADPIAGALEQLPLIAPYRQAVALGIVVVFVTYLSLILGELVPKRIALHDPEAAASRVARPMGFLGRLAGPVVGFLTWSTDRVYALLRLPKEEEPEVTEEEIKALMERGLAEGEFVPEERNLVERVFQLEERRVGSVATPRTEISWLDLDDPLAETEKQILKSPHSRLPVAKGSLDDVVGIAQAKDLLAMCLSGEELDLHRALRDPVFVPESMPSFAVLEKFREARVQFALVLDEYGGLQGLVTTNDLLEGLVGEIPVAGEESERPFLRADGSWLLGGMLSMEEFKDLFELADIPGEERAIFETLGGFVMAQFGRIPAVGDRFTWRGMQFEVMDMDGKRVDKVLVRPPDFHSSE
jgi:putative hemolysin